MHRFKELEIWRRSTSFCVTIYEATQHLPTLEKFGLMNQLCRAAVSIPSNIAEGSSRNSNKEFKRFLQIALGSAYEIETQLLISHRLNFLSKEALQSLLKELQEIIKITAKFNSNLTV